jgi:hypothetical protein
MARDSLGHGTGTSEAIEETWERTRAWRRGTLERCIGSATALAWPGEDVVGGQRYQVRETW